MLHRAYYYFKPLIPRRVQIAFRRLLVRRKFKKVSAVWPIDQKAGKAPEGWRGWPEGKQFALVLTHDVETKRGYDKCRVLAELEQSLGFRSSFNFLTEEYPVSPDFRKELIDRGFEVGIHGLTHDGHLYRSRETFAQQAVRINRYLKEWQAVGFRSPSMHRNLEWISDFDIAYDASTFDTDPFEPYPDGEGTIFPFFVKPVTPRPGYVELPYTLPQDFTLFVIMQQKSIETWQKKLDWIAEQGGMALLITHPDYMVFNGSQPRIDEYGVKLYRDFLEYVKTRYGDRCWYAIPRDVARTQRLSFQQDALGSRE